MKTEKSVQARKTKGEMPLGRARGDTSRNPTFATKLHGTGRALTDFEHLVSPTGRDERMRIEQPGNQTDPRQGDHGAEGSSGD